MNKKELARFIINDLEKRYPSPEVPLKHSDIYTLLIAVLLSAQCTDARVNTITPLLFKKASSPEEMVKLNVGEIEDIIRPCGLAPTKSKAIWALSKILLDRYEGEVPDSLEELEALPGVGHKTASVVMIQGFHRPAFPVDTHIHRCAERWGLSDGKSVLKTEKDLKALFPKKKWAKLHLQMIFFAREFCPAKAHSIEKCPICSVLQGE